MLKIITKIKDIYSSNYMNQNINNKNISNMKIKNNSNKLLILFTIVFGMGFSSRVVFGSSEPVYSNIDSKFEKNEEIESSDIIQYTEFSEKSIISYSKNFIFVLYQQSTDMFGLIIGEIIKTSEKEKKTILQNLTTINANYKSRSGKKYQNDIKRILSNYDKALIGSLFSIDFSFFIRKILDEYLYDLNERLQALSFIRNLSDISFIDRSCYNQQLLKKLDEKLIRIFPDSRRLLLNISIEQLFFNRLGIDFNNFYKLNEESTIVKFNTKEGRFTFFKREEKPDGVNDGFILAYLEGNSEDENNANIIDRFYIKKYHKGSMYTRRKHRNSHETGDVPITTPVFLASSTSRSMTSSRSNSSVRFFNLKEPIIYSVLEILNLGPNKEFIINPYVDRGFYIATRDLSLEGKYFSTMTNIEFSFINKKKEQTELCKHLKNSASIYDNISIGLNELDLFATIFLLEDMNTGNYGVVFDNEDDFKSKISMTSTTTSYIRSNQFRIIDFAYPIARQDKRYGEYYTYKDSDNFYREFISLGGQEVFYSLKFDHNLSFVGNQLGIGTNRLKFSFQALQQFQSRLGNARPIDNEEIGEIVFNFITFGEDTDDFQLREILKQKSLEIKSLMLEERGTNDKPQEFMLRDPREFLESEEEYYNYFTDPESGRLLVHQEFLESNMNILRFRRSRTNAELIGFKSRNDIPRLQEESLNLEYIEDAFEDLDNYCKGIMNNYKTLKRFIIDGYYKYFDEQGNPKIQSVSEE